MTGQIYTASFSEVAVTALQDLFQLLASGTVPIEILSVRIGQSSDAGDAAAEMLPIILSSSDVTINGSGGTTVTPRPHSPGPAIAAVTVAEVNNTTQSTVTTEIVSDTFNVQAGWLYQPPEAEQLIILPTEAFIVELPKAPTDSLDFSGSVTFKELR